MRFKWVVVWMVLIFCFSHQPAQESSKLSREVTEVVVHTVERVVPDVSLDARRVHLLVRKNGHFFAYMLLGVLVLDALSKSGIGGKRALGLAFVVCVLYAASDEFHQAFVPGRGALVADVLLDSAGAAVGLGLYLLVGRVRGVLPGEGDEDAL